MAFILGKKLGMSQLFNSEGKSLPITLIEAGPMKVTQVKTKEKDGYISAQFGFGQKKKINKPLSGHLKDLGNFRYLRESRYSDEKNIPAKGEKIDVSVFKEGDWVKVSGISKSYGFQGVVKRHGFRGAPKTHGTKHAHREPGSIGSTWPQRILKGKKMAGRMGGERKTVKNLKVVKIDKENNIMAVLGAVPGRKGGLLEIKS